MKKRTTYGAFALLAAMAFAGCEIEEEHGPRPYIQGQPPSTSKSTPYLYGSAIVGEQSQWTRGEPRTLMQAQQTLSNRDN